MVRSWGDGSSSVLDANFRAWVAHVDPVPAVLIPSADLVHKNREKTWGLAAEVSERDWRQVISQVERVAAQAQDHKVVLIELMAVPQPRHPSRHAPGAEQWWNRRESEPDPTPPKSALAGADRKPTVATRQDDLDGESFPYDLKRLRLKYGGLCKACGLSIDVRGWGFWSKAARSVWCIGCGPDPDLPVVTAAEPESKAPAVPQRPTQLSPWEQLCTYSLRCLEAEAAEGVARFIDKDSKWFHYEGTASRQRGTVARRRRCPPPWTRPSDPRRPTERG